MRNPLQGTSAASAPRSSRRCGWLRDRKTSSLWRKGGQSRRLKRRRRKGKWMVQQGRRKRAHLCCGGWNPRSAFGGLLHLYLLRPAVELVVMRFVTQALYPFSHPRCEAHRCPLQPCISIPNPRRPPKLYRPHQKIGHGGPVYSPESVTLWL